MSKIISKKLIISVLSFFLLIFTFIAVKEITTQAADEPKLYCHSQMPVGRTIDDAGKFSKTLLGYLNEIQDEADIQYNRAQDQVTSATDLLPLPAQCGEKNGYDYTCKDGMWFASVLCCPQRCTVTDDEGNEHEVCCTSLFNMCVSCGCFCYYGCDSAKNIINNYTNQLQGILTSAKEIRQKCENGPCAEKKGYSADCGTNICFGEVDDPDPPGNIIDCSETTATTTELCNKCERAVCQREEKIETSISGTKICPHIEYNGNIIDCYQSFKNANQEIDVLSSNASSSLSEALAICQGNLSSVPCPPQIWGLIKSIENNYFNDAAPETPSVKKSFDKISDIFNYLQDLIEGTYLYPNKNKVYRNDIINELAGLRVALNNCSITAKDYYEIMKGEKPMRGSFACRTIIDLKESGLIVKIKGGNICARGNFPECPKDFSDPSYTPKCYLVPDNLYINYLCCILQSE